MFVTFQIHKWKYSDLGHSSKEMHSHFEWSQKRSYGSSLQQRRHSPCFGIKRHSDYCLGYCFRVWTLQVQDILQHNMRLNGHKDMVTDCVFLDSSKRIISASKDSFVKIWDMETQHCVQTLVGHRAEVWSIDVNPSETRLVTGSVDNKLRVWSLDPSEFETLQQTKSSEEEVDPVSKMIEDEGEENVAVFFGSIERPGTNRVERLRFNASGTLLGCHVERSVYLFAITPTSEVSAKAKKRFKKEKKRLKKMEVDIPGSIHCNLTIRESSTISSR